MDGTSSENINHKMSETSSENIDHKMSETSSENTEQVMEADSSESETFKAPLILPTGAQSSKDIDEKKEANKTPTVPHTKSEKVTKKKLIAVPLPYKEPEWGGSPPPNFNFEVIKNGTFVSTVPIRTSFFVFGRLDVCDVVFEHPSVSRYHAIIQYCRGDDLHPKGFYLYDLGSTHGTFLNKNPVKSKIYYKLKVGYILKFGGSSRLHIFQGPEEEEETEDKKPVPVAEPEACTWGIDDDDDNEEEEDENAVNPFALSTPNEELYLEDPKKTLRGWFEREGYELEYHVEEKGFKSFMCIVKLPVDTPTGEFMPVEASVTGKKKEAVIACALEACRTLDRLGLLRQSQQESRQRKRKKWEENDYYDSDEDTFYDRTGDIERRREMRKKLATKKTTTENFQTLETKLKDLNAEIDEVKQKLDACTAKKSLAGNEGEDSLESFMSSLAATANAPTDKFQRRKLMLRLAEAEKERAHLEKLLNIAKPSTLPPVSKHVGMIGKRLKSKLHIPLSKPKETAKLEEKDEGVEEEDDDEKDKGVTEEKESNNHEKNDDNKRSDGNSNDKVSVSPERMEVDDQDEVHKPKKYGLTFVSKDPIHQQEEAFNTQPVKDSGLMDSENTSLPTVEKVSALDKPKAVIEDKIGSRYSIPQPKASKKTNSKKDKNNVDVYKTETAEYSTWTPPANQSGDGKTHLNAKYGY